MYRDPVMNARNKIYTETGSMTHLERPRLIRMGRAEKSLLLVVCLLLFFVCSHHVLANSRRPISETQIRDKKNRCFQDIDNGLWGHKCKSSMIAKENCMLQCVSPPCYELVYEGDPLEEGEKDYSRSQEYKYCMHRLSLGESIDGIRGSFDM